MRDRPEGLNESDLRRALCAWEIDAMSLTYAPVGFGDYHWTAVDAGGRRWFVTVADLAHKVQCGQGVEAAFRGLCRAMDTASALDLGGLDFAVAPLRTTHGETVRRLGAHHAISVFPFADGTAGHFGQALTSRERGMVVDILAELHRTTPPAFAPVLQPELPTRALLEETLGRLGRPWHGGPFAEPARALVADHAFGVRRRLAEFDQRVAELNRSVPELVVTHGEPHPGNLLWPPDRCLLVDWDTVGLAVPERDLWLVAEGPDDLAWYAGVTGREPDLAALALYRLRWELDDVAVYLDWFRSPHDRTPDTEQAWAALTGTVEHLTGDVPG
ncbi:MAG TPA: phosphotransferase [Mycobacteriales bacterium]